MDISLSTMDPALLPDSLQPVPGDENSSQLAVSFTPYASAVPIIKGKSKLRQNMISLIMEGEKIIYVDGQPIHVEPDHILLLAAGNYLYTERFPGSDPLKSMLIFFDDAVLQSLDPPDAADQSTEEAGSPKASLVLFPKDDYLKTYLTSLQALLTPDGHLPLYMQSLKVSELLLYLRGTYPRLFASFQSQAPRQPAEHRIKQIVHDNLMNKLSISELAFLCNMSPATFKRKFAALYRTSPQKWMQERRLQTAADWLSRKKGRPADIYLAIGYESHSSFSQAFKAYFGVVPSAYTGQQPIRSL